ncbi:uncharacterized protein LOC131944085 isoform X2 [Physella acuta]|uniref:uncharacterized protein LOC131944085 isoform X2 n=1 Tax=Physella acuta TaxID=109671 RepID=UPI0027DC9216|nr:uncharacterized protein LOC131944085 isoform X2 [Physella acuta]
MGVFLSRFVKVRTIFGFNHRRNNTTRDVYREGWDALMKASNDGNDALVAILLSQGSDVNLKNYDGNDALMLASRNGHEACVELLLNKGSDVNRCNKQGWNSLHLATIRGSERCVELLLSKGSCVNIVDKDGFDSLMLASAKGYEKCVEQLLNKGSDVNRTDQKGWNALMLASMKGYDKCADLLIKHGSDVNKSKLDRWDALMLASSNGHDKCVELLLDAGCDVNEIKSDGWNVLLRASSNGDYKIVELLLNRGCDINTLDQFGCDALILASRNGNAKCVEYLLDHGCDGNHIVQDGWDALMFAAHNGHEDCLKLLIDAGCCLSRIDRHGRDSTNLAARQGHLKCVNVLISHVIEKALEGAINTNTETHATKTYVHNQLTQREKSVIYNKLFIFLMEVFFSAFECGQGNVVDILLNSFHRIAGYYDLTKEIHIIPRICWCLQECLKSELQKQSSSTVVFANMMKEFQNELNEDDRRRLNDIESSLSSYAQIVSNNLLNKKSKCQELFENLETTTKEFLYMTTFEPLHFFVYQKSVTKCYCEIVNTFHYKQDTFFSLLLDLNYPDRTLNCLRKANLLNITVSRFSFHLVRDSLLLLWEGCKLSLPFATRLAECNFLVIITDYFNCHKNVQCMESDWITDVFLNMLKSMAARRELKEYMKTSRPVLLNISFQNPLISLMITLLLWAGEDNTITEFFKDADKNNREMFIENIKRTVQFDGSYSRVMPLIETLTNMLKQKERFDTMLVIRVLKDLTDTVNTLREILSNDKLADVLMKLNTNKNEDISKVLNTILWKTGNATGMLPLKQDILVSENFPNQFIIKEEALGEGAFGSVHLVTDLNRPDEEKYVAKRLKISDFKNKDVFTNEAMILFKLKHNRIVEFHGFQKLEDTFLIFLEYLKNGTLASFVSKNIKLEEQLTRHFTIQILQGVDYLHQNKILHRDIKGNNVLMVDDMNIKITDFGISEIIDGSGVETEKGTIRYMAPEERWLYSCRDVDRKTTKLVTSDATDSRTDCRDWCTTKISTASIIF